MSGLKWLVIIPWRLIFGPPEGNFVTCLACMDNDDLDEELEAIERFERKTA